MKNIFRKISHAIVHPSICKTHQQYMDYQQTLHRIFTYCLLCFDNRFLLVIKNTMCSIFWYILPKSLVKTTEKLSSYIGRTTFK